MVTYTTKFPIDKNFSENEFVKLVLKWNQGSKFDKINDLYWNEQDYECEWKQDNITLIIQKIDSESIVASRLCKEDEYGMWFTDFVLNNSKGSIAISVSLETTEFTTDFFPTYYPPFFVKMVLFENYAGNDNGLKVMNKEHNVEEEMDFFRDIVTKRIASELPVVFVARTLEGKNPLNVNQLAFRIQGVAHVICEPESGIRFEGLSDILDSMEAKVGKIFIFYPSHNKKSRIINLTGSSKEADYFEDIIVTDVYNYMNSRMRSTIDTWDGVSTEELHIINRELLNDHTAIEEEIGNLWANNNSYRN